MRKKKDMIAKLREAEQWVESEDETPPETEEAKHDTGQNRGADRLRRRELYSSQRSLAVSEASRHAPGHGVGVTEASRHAPGHSMGVTEAAKPTHAGRRVSSTVSCKIGSLGLHDFIMLPQV